MARTHNALPHKGSQRKWRRKSRGHVMLGKSRLPAMPPALCGLKADELASLEKKFTNLNLLNSKQEHFFEVDTQAIRVLNILCGDDYNYRITSQSMAMEKTNIGGRTIQVQNLVWTLGKQV